MSETPTDVALRYIREELATFRTAVNDLSGEVRAHMLEQGKLIPVLTHRVTEVEKDIGAVQLAHEELMGEVRADGRESRRVRWAMGTSLTVSVLGWVPALIAVFAK